MTDQKQEPNKEPETAADRGRWSTGADGVEPLSIIETIDNTPEDRRRGNAEAERIKRLSLARAQAMVDAGEAEDDDDEVAAAAVKD